MAEEQKNFKRRYSIFWVLSLSMVILVVAPLFFYSQKAIESSKETITGSLRERQLLTADPAAKHVETVINEYRRHLQDLANAFEIYSNEPDVQRAYEEILGRDILSRFVSRDSFYLMYLDRSGNQLASAWQPLEPGVEESWADQLRHQALRAISDRATVNSGVFFVKVASLGGVSTPAIAISVPIRAGSEMTASVSGIFLLDGVQSSLENYGRDFTLFVTDQQGRLVFHTDPTQAGRGTDLSANPVVSRVLGTGAYPTSPVNINVTDPGGVTYLVTYAPIRDYGWILFTQVDRELYFAPVQQLVRQSRIWILSFTLITLVVGFALNKVITKPISDLTEFSRSLARGDFSRRTGVGIRNEIGELARAFNFMAEQIQKYITQLEEAAEENKQLFMNSIRAIANAIDAKDPYTRGHSERVSAYSMIIAREAGLDERMLRIIEISSLLHDVGKIGIEDKILRKPGALTNDEFAVMKTHPGKGGEILGSIPQMKEIIPGIRHHHEKWSGGGYPDGLVGEQIPGIARIIGVSDAFDAMTTNRPYQKAMTFPMAAARINELAVTVYDSRIVEAFNRAYQKGAFQEFQDQVREAKLA